MSTEKLKQKSTSLYPKSKVLSPNFCLRQPYCAHPASHQRQRTPYVVYFCLNYVVLKNRILQKSILDRMSCSPLWQGSVWGCLVSRARARARSLVLTSGSLSYHSSVTRATHQNRYQGNFLNAVVAFRPMKHNDKCNCLDCQ